MTRLSRLCRRGIPVVLALSLLLVDCGRDGEPVSGEHLVARGRGAGHNLLLITVDTLRADRLGCYGWQEARTPRIDALAATGIRFEQATSAVPLTLPSHATMMTGLVPPEHGVRVNGTFRLAAEHVTLAERLQSAGYATAAFIGAFVLDARFGLAQGFELYDDSVDPRPLDHPSMAAYHERRANQVVDRAIGWLDSRRRNAAADGRPFLVWLHLFDPHAPYAPPQPYAHFFPDDPYQGEIAFADAEIGRLVDDLRRHGELDRTWIVLVSDHGEGLGDHDEMTHGDLIYDSTMRVPMILSNPVVFPRAEVVEDRVAGLVDLFPTLLHLLGLSHGALPQDGVNLLGPPPPRERTVYLETLAPLLDYGWAPLFGLRRRADKWILAPTPEYYAVSDDREERSNLYPRAEAARELRAELDRQLERWPSPLAAIDAELDLSDEELERLEALGYVRPARRRAELGTQDPKEMMRLWKRMQEAGELSIRGEHRRAAERIESVLDEDPGSAKGWYTAMRIFDRAGDYERAEKAVRRALALSPRAEGWVILARYALNRGERESFDRALTEAERLDPLDGGIYIGRGHALAMDGDYASARTEFERAIEVDPVRSGLYARQQIERLRELLGEE